MTHHSSLITHHFRLGLAISLVFVVLVTCAGVAYDGLPRGIGIGDPYFPYLGNPGYDAQHYTIDLSVDLPTNTVAGSMTMIALATDDLTTVGFDYSGPAVSAITVNGSDAAFSRNETSKLIVTLPALLPKGKPFTVVVTYAGSPEAVPYPTSYDAPGWIHTDDSVIAVGAPDGSSAWFPVNEHPLDKATYSFLITVDQPYQVIANGVLKSVTKNGAQSTYDWEMTYPMASYLVTMDIGNFVTQESTSADGVPIRNYFAANLDQSAADALFSQEGAMLDYFSTLFGAYPFDHFGSIVVGIPLNFAMETQGMTTFGADFIPKAKPNDPTSGEGQIAHELGHEWFGDSVSLTTFRDIWLNEGFATYASWLWIEHSSGESVMQSLVQSTDDILSGAALRQAGLSADEVRQRLLSFAITGDPTPQHDFDWEGIYLRGALTLHALRLTLGDTTFFDVLKAYQQKYRYGNATTADLIAVADQVSGRDLGDFFQHWLYDPIIPPLPSGSGS